MSSSVTQVFPNVRHCLPLWSNLILRSTSETTDTPCQHLSESPTLSHRGGRHASLTWMAKRQRATGCSGGGEELSVDRVELDRSWRIMNRPGASAATSITLNEWTTSNVLMKNDKDVVLKISLCTGGALPQNQNLFTGNTGETRSVAIRMIC